VQPVLILTGADLVLPQAIAPDCPLPVIDGRIGRIGAHAPGQAGSRELHLPGRIILPGLIDLHSDVIEKFVEPRPKVFFPLPFACRECDKWHLAAGITTVFNSVAIAGRETGVRDPELAANIIRALRSTPSLLKRRLHLRFEVTDSPSVPLIERLIDEGQVDLLSFMDHGPGQGQYPKRGEYFRYLMRTYAMTEREARRLLAIKMENKQGRTARTIRQLTRFAVQRSIPMISHDLDTARAVARWRRRGATISEFPINEEAGQASRKHGMVTVMGAPNIIRGASSGRALRAIDGIRMGLVDVLCSDYMPACLLPALFKAAAELRRPLADMVAMATWKAADAAGLRMVGRIAEGCSADLLVVRPGADGPQLEAVMVDGQWRWQLDGWQDGPAAGA
jgi:alpha-D-ribose 1-methylphosphonate 5-triphosphate diphosphatase